MEDDKENKAKIENLTNVIKKLGDMATSHQMIMTDSAIDDESKKQVDILYKRYISTFSPYLEEISKSEVEQIQKLLQSNKQTLDKVATNIDKAVLAEVTKDTVELDKSNASKKTISLLNAPKLRADITKQKALIAHHMASYAIEVSELADKTTKIVADDLAYVRKEYNKLAAGKSKAEIEGDDLAQNLKRLETELEGRQKRLSDFKDNKGTLASLSDKDKNDLAKITRDQAFRLKSLSTVLGGSLEETGNQLALLSSSVEPHGQADLENAVKGIYGNKAEEFLGKLKEYEKGTDIAKNKQDMKNLIGIAPEAIGTTEAVAISNSPFDINNAYNQQVKTNIAPKEYMLQFYTSVVFNTTTLYQVDPATKETVFSPEQFGKWKKSVGVTETEGPEASKKKDKHIELYSEKALFEESKKHKSKNTLTPLEHQAIELFAKGRKNGHLTDLDRKLLSSFISYAAGNKEFNQRLSSVLRSESNFVKSHENEIDMIHKFTYKSTFHSQVVNSVNKLDKIMTGLEDQQDTEFKDKEKITLKELGKIGKYLDTEDVLKFVKARKLNNLSPKLAEMLKTSDQAKEVFTTYGDKIKDNTIYEEGDLVMDVAKRYHDVELHRNRGLKSMVADVITPYSHAAIGTRIGKEGEKIVSGVSEVWRDYNQNEISWKNSLMSETFRVFPDKLIRDEAIKREMCKALNVKDEIGLKNKLRDLYRDISKELNNAEALENANIENDRGRREKAGKADFIPFGHKGKQNISDWATAVLNVKQDLAQNIKDPKAGDTMICSEFAAKMTVLSLVELEKKMAEKIKEQNPDFVAPKKGLLKLPFDKKEDLGKVHPARLIKSLKEANAIEKISKPKAIKNSVMFR